MSGSIWWLFSAFALRCGQQAQPAGRFWRLHQNSLCGLCILTADKITNYLDLPGRYARIFKIRSCFHLISSYFPVCFRHGHGRSGGCKLAVCDRHIFRNVYGHMPAPIVYRDGVTNKDGKWLKPAPSLDDFLFTCLFNSSTFFNRWGAARAFLNTSAHLLISSLLGTATLNYELIGGVVGLAGLVSQVGLPQGVTGPGRPTGDLPSPPPCGGNRVHCRTEQWASAHVALRPALPMETFA